MTDTPLMEGKISFVHHDKDYVTIDYVHNGKKKSINGKVDEARQLQLKEENLIRKIHKFNEGDEVYFTIERSARGDKMVAERIQYRYNNALGNLINRATTDNRFAGYLKMVDEKYFVKETGSYLFFPLILSPWEIKPDINKLNEPVFFRLENTEHPQKLTASLFQQRFIPEYTKAQKYFADKTVINAQVFKTTPHGIYVNVIGDKIQAKIPVTKAVNDKQKEPEIKAGDTVKIIITYLGSLKIAVALA